MQTQGRAVALVMLAVCLAWPPVAAAQVAFDARELANYRLTRPVFTRFVHASRLIDRVIRHDARYTSDPLFTADLIVAGDAVEAAVALHNRLDSDPALAAALFAADLSAHEYTTFALALIGARLAHGFLESGAMRRVPPGAPADNVAFVRANLAEVTSVLKQLGID